VNDDRNLAVFCDFENMAFGARDAKYASFDMQLVLQKLLLKGSIVLKKAYCDWNRYKEFKATMHEAAFELIVRQSGKNSADIRMVVDALDLCYTKEHINTFVIISGDADFSPLVSKSEFCCQFREPVKCNAERSGPRQGKGRLDPRGGALSRDRAAHGSGAGASRKQRQDQVNRWSTEATSANSRVCVPYGTDTTPKPCSARWH
jgi:hypothetical protein